VVLILVVSELIHRFLFSSISSAPRAGSRRLPNSRGSPRSTNEAAQGLAEKKSPSLNDRVIPSCNPFDAPTIVTCTCVVLEVLLSIVVACCWEGVVPSSAQEWRVARRLDRFFVKQVAPKREAGYDAI